MSGLERLSEIVREARGSRRWTQSEVAQRLGVSKDAVRRIEGDRYPLPTRQRTGGHQLDKVLAGLGLDQCDVIRRCFPDDEILASVYKKCLESPSESDQHNGRELPRAGSSSLKDYANQLPATKQALLGQAAMLNAQAMAFLISLERMFDKFEFLVTNQPPFVLFADNEYVTEGSSSTELEPADRAIYHDLIFSHQRDMRARVEQGRKQYRIVLHKDPLIDFLAHRSVARATRIVADVQDFLRYPSMDLVIVDQYSESDEFEVLAGHYPFSRTVQNDAISVRHRRIGLGNTTLYQLSLIGMSDHLVAEDYSRADAMWRAGLDELDELPKSYAAPRQAVYAERRKRIVATLLDEALAAAHPKNGT